MIKSFIDILWIVSSMSLYLLFFKLNNMNSDTPINFFNNISILKKAVSIDYLVILVIAFFPIIFLQIYRFFIKANDTLRIKSIKIAEPVYIPVYIGYFVIAMGITDKMVFYIFSAILIILIATTKMFYFNPTLLLLGYHYYEIQDEKETNMLLITKRENLKGNQEFQKLHRLNNFVFLDNYGKDG